LIEIVTNSDHGARIRVVGVGGGGGNAINSMIDKGLNSVDFIALNTDVQALECNQASYKIQIGKNLTKGLGAGADPEKGRKAVEESKEEVANLLSGSDMVFVTAGMGGGTGTGGAPLVANIAKSNGSLVVGIVTKPFSWEGNDRAQKADEGIKELRKHVDTLITIPNNRILDLVDKKTPIKEAFNLANQVLFNATKGISELIMIPGVVNVDFADVRTIMQEMGDAMMGTGCAKGENRSIEAAQSAISSPLLEGVSISGARGVLVNITGGNDMAMSEIDEAMKVISEAVGDGAKVIFGCVIDEKMSDDFIVTVIATGFNKKVESVPEIIPMPPKITRISTPVNSIADASPAPVQSVSRKETPDLLNNILNDNKGYKPKFDRSDPNKPAFLRKIMD
jgi:cell division protein FtsZ